MPTYSYQCKNCGHILEAFQNMNDPVLKECSDCRQETLERVLLSAPSFALKGSGWYKTDYPKDKTASMSASPNVCEKTEKSTATKPASSDGSN